MLAGTSLAEEGAEGLVLLGHRLVERTVGADACTLQN